MLFRAIVFDWDGTAVPDRRADCGPLNEALSRLLSQGVLAIVVTGTSMEHVFRNCLEKVPHDLRRNLYICANRGSEVYGFTDDGAPSLRYRRMASRSELQALDDAVRELQKELRDHHGLETAIVFNRMNRRKLDLLPSTAEPPKSELPQLQREVSQKLEKAGVRGGLPELAQWAVAAGQKHGLPAPQVTSDAKHLEIGLTSKAHSALWILQQLLPEQDIRPADTVFIGDEFGPLGGLPGSDLLMKVAESAGARFYSVGPEPEGLPPEVEHLHGQPGTGPEGFRRFLEDQAAQWKARAHGVLTLSPVAAPEWRIEQEGFDPSMVREIETLFTIGNGALGVRGAINSPIAASQADLIIAGIYDKKSPLRPYSELDLLVPESADYPDSEIVTLPFPFRATSLSNGTALELTGSAAEAHRAILDLRDGLYFEEDRFPLEQGELRVKTLRCCSMSDPHLLIHEIELSLAGESQVPIEVELDCTIGPHSEADFEAAHPHLLQVAFDRGPLSEFRHYRTRGSTQDIALACRLWELDQERPGSRLSLQLSQGRPIRITRTISVFTSRDGDDPQRQAKDHALRQRISTIPAALSEHVAKWREAWKAADIVFERNRPLTQAHRFNAYHLLIAAPRDHRASIGARTLSGRAYGGHVFWDVEIFLLPFYLYRFPEVARNLLLYRYHTLNGARANARKLGYEGACYAWESTVTGADVTPRRLHLRSLGLDVPIYTGSEQIHVTADVAFALWRYCTVTGDLEFRRDYAAEMLFETARFWASRVAPQDGRYHILSVVGPDEYHHGVDDNAYTNWMARFNLLEAIDTAEWLQNEHPGKWHALRARLSLTTDEIHTWQDVCDGLYLPEPNRDGVIEQFRGFFDLKPFPLGPEGRFKAPVARLIHWSETNQAKIIKQADVLMLFFAFPDLFDEKTMLANFRYYEPLTDHGSSLSPGVHALVAARLGLTAEALAYYDRCLNLDLLNEMENTGLGIHAACIGASWQALVFGFLGANARESQLYFDSMALTRLPAEWSPVRLRTFTEGQLHLHRLSRRRRAAEGGAA